MKIKQRFYAIFMVIACSASWYMDANILQFRPHCSARVLYDAKLQVQLHDFCMNVLRMQSSDEWAGLQRDVTSVYPCVPTDIQLYQQLKKSYQNMQPISRVYRLYQALKFQQFLLGGQVKQILPDRSVVHGYAEIGGACRYADVISQHTEMTGMRYAVHDSASVQDVLESNRLHVTKGLVPYDVMIPLSDYDPVSAVDIPDASVDMVVCFIGLHHIPTEKLNAFVQSIVRIIRPGGTFILRDHDAFNQDIFDLACAAHTIFNAIVPQCSDEEECCEIRNFQPMQYWIDIIEQHGLQVGDARILQQGDPTLNTMIAFRKPMMEEDVFLKKMHEQKDYVRYHHQTFLTAPEWFNVDCSQAYGEFLEHTPWYEFPYVDCVTTYWKIFWQSLQQARKLDSLYTILMHSDYFSTNLFIGSFMTVEYFMKAMIAYPVLKMSQSYDTKIAIVVKNCTVQTLEKLPKSVMLQDGFHDMKVLQVARYKDFQQTVKILADESCQIVEIGGQRTIQVKIRIPDTLTSAELLEKLKSGMLLHDAHLAYTWRLPTQAYLYGSVVIPVGSLSNFIQYAHEMNTQIVYIHDF